ncbi:MAG: FAD-dependent oxidoreductase [Deltaproteobacteria bacterium]|nr:FAD-dependent oxidoreductase [Deltaproteobacteria bacterium]
MSDNLKKIDCDVLIIGGGLAASMAALEAAKRGMRVTLVDKGRLGRSGSSPTSGGVPQAAFGHADPRDNTDVHFKDTLVGGEFISQQKIVRAIVNEVTDRIIDLEELGLQFKKTEGGQKFYQEKRLGSSYARSVPPIGGSVGMLGHLRKEVFNREVDVHQWIMITRLFKEQERVMGALGFNVQTGEFCLYKAKAVVLAAGSAVGLQKYTSANFQTTGDAYLLAFNVGAKLTNLEFLEFTLIPAPNGIVIPMAGLSPFTSKGGRFFNALGQRFLEKYDPERLENTTRAILVGAAYKEILEGRGPVYIDPSYIPDEKWDMEIQYEYSPKLSKAGINCRSDRFEWVPALHTFLGGMFINERCETEVSGLFGAGESATGTHGANRLSGNAIASAFVLGTRAGKFASLFARENSPGSVNKKEVNQEINRIETFKRNEGLDPYKVLAEIKDTAWESTGVVRNGNGLEDGVKRFQEIKADKVPKIKAEDMRSLVKAIECSNLSWVGEMVARSALTRTESRGQHQREDYPTQDNKKWLNWVVIYKERDKVAQKIEPIPFEDVELKPPL